MKIFVFLGVCFFGAVLGATQDDKCEQEMRKMRICARQSRVDVGQWDQKDFQDQIPRFEEALKCIGEPTCEYNKKSLEKSKLRMEIASFWSKSLVGCLGNDNYEDMKRKCLPRDKEIKCDDQEDLKCLMDEIGKHKDCSDEDAELFESKYDRVVKYCELKKELKEMRKAQA